MDETQTREGLGFLMAEEHAQQRAAVADAELDAWEAEKALERERFALALRREQLLQHQGLLAKQEMVHRRQAVKEIELNRSRASVSLNNRSRGSQQHLNSTPDMSKSAGWTVQVVAGGAKEPAHVLAARHKAQRAEELRVERARVAHQRRSIAERAIAVVAQQKDDEQRRLLEEEQDVLLRLQMIENAMRSTVRPISSSDFQEQESRKAQSASSKAAREFERVFLATTVWPLNEIRRTHHAPVERASSLDASAAPSIFADSSVALLLASPTATRLQPRLFEPSFVADDEEEEEEEEAYEEEEAQDNPVEGMHPQSPAAGEDATPQPDVMNTSVEGPRCSDSQPQPIPRTSPSPPAPAVDGQSPLQQQDEASDGRATATALAAPQVTAYDGTAAVAQQAHRPPRGPPTPAALSPLLPAVVVAAQPADGTAANTSSAAGAADPAATSAAAPVLRERHEQFLRDLQRLQQRLAQASIQHEDDDDVRGSRRPRREDGAAADGINDSTSTTMTSEGSDVSLSSMSADADGTMRPRKTSSGMTAEQLRNALRKMKFCR